MSKQTKEIRYLENEKPVVFAARELKLYLEQMTGWKFRCIPEECYRTGLKETLWVGSATNFPQADPPSVTDKRFDDALHIETDGCSGVITGNNPRSTLIAAYRFLTELGCRWVGPESTGEFIPDITLEGKQISVSEKASYRHRGVCIEGATAYEHVVNMVDLLPKLGLNSYFIQFREAYTFFARWYEHMLNPLKDAEEFSRKKAREMVENIVAEIEKRGLIYHAVGHGWTCEPFGIPGLGWEQSPPSVPEEAKQYLAEVDGKRELWNGVPLNTNLCYSQPEVRELIIDDIVGYLDEHQEIDLLHFWLADGSNNQCECEDCRRMRPADFYVKMLNELDEALTEKGRDTKIVFLIYVDLLWPPESTQIRNPDRFILMFAPITRNYLESLDDTGSTSGSIDPFKRNQLAFPDGAAEYLDFLAAWQEVFSGDSFDFDYHFMWEHYFDPGYMRISRVLYDDIRAFNGVDLNGLISCQTQRFFLPTGLGMAVMGRTLWDRETEFNEIRDDHLRTTFGEGWEKCRDYLEELSRLWAPITYRNQGKLDSEKACEIFERTQEIIADFMPVIDTKIKKNGEFNEKNWLYLKHHAELYSLLARAAACELDGNQKEAQKLWDSLKETAAKKEPLLHQLFDVFLFLRTAERRFTK